MTVDREGAQGGGAAAGWLAAMAPLLASLCEDPHLRDRTRAAAEEAARTLFAARDEWRETREELDRQREQLAGLRAELADLEATIGRVYTALEEESWPTEPRRPG